MSSIGPQNLKLAQTFCHPLTGTDADESKEGPDGNNFIRPF